MSQRGGVLGNRSALACAFIAFMCERETEKDRKKLKTPKRHAGKRDTD